MDKASGLPARRAALAILSDVLRKRRALDVATADVLSRTKLDERDAAFAFALPLLGIPSWEERARAR